MKKIILLVLMIGMLFVLCSCGNRDMFDTVRTYNYAIIAFPNGDSVTIEIKQWRDYEGEQIQITAEDGTVYLVNSVNCTLVKRGK